MSLSKIIPDDEAGEAKPWDMPELRRNVVSLNTDGNEDMNLVALREDMIKKGFQEGYEAGLEKATQQAENHRNQLETLFVSLNQPLQRLNDAVEHEVIELALEVARLILRREISQDPKHIIGLIRKAVKQLPAASRGVRIHLHPDDAKLIRETINQQDDDQRWQIRDDPTLPQGGCQIHTETSFVDAGIDALITRLNIELLGGNRTTDIDEATDVTE